MIAPLTLGQAPAANAQAACTFQLGFSTLRTMVGGATVGDCTQNERGNGANGNTEQRTTKGLLVWRKADNWTAFTNGNETWINAGPRGLVRRLNSQRFAWEADAGAPGTTVAAAAVTVPAPDPWWIGGWSHHGFGLTVQSDGTSTASWRTYKWCEPRASPPGSPATGSSTTSSRTGARPSSASRRRRPPTGPCWAR